MDFLFDFVGNVGAVKAEVLLVNFSICVPVEDLLSYFAVKSLYGFQVVRVTDVIVTVLSASASVGVLARVLINVTVCVCAC